MSSSLTKDFQKTRISAEAQVDHASTAVKMNHTEGFGSSEGVVVPGPLTLRMMLRVVSSMNSTRTWVTPPREPVYWIPQLIPMRPNKSAVSTNRSFPERE